MEEKLAALVEHLAAVLPGVVQGSEIHHGELAIATPRDAVIEVLTILRDDPQCRFTVLCDICGVDHPDRPERFDVVYNLLSMSRNLRIRVKLQTDEEQPVPSCTGVFSAAGWWEREAFDLYGIVFDGHPDLRRIFMWEEFTDYPMRKDYIPPADDEEVLMEGARP